MATFPNTRSAAVEVYYPIDPVRIDFDLLRDVIEDQRLHRSVPEDWSSLDDSESAEEVVGTCYPDDADNLLVVHRYYAWGLRRWERSVPASTVRAAVAQRRKDLLADADAKGVEIDKGDLSDALKEYKRTITRQLLARAVPRVSEDVIVWDDEHQRLFVFSASGPVRDRLRLHAEDVLAHANSGERVPLVRWTVDGALKRQRPTAVPPANLEHRFAAWLIWHAHRGPRTLAIPVDGQTRYVHVEIDGRLIVNDGDGKRRYEGDDVVERHLNHAISPLDKPAALYPLHSVDLTIGVPETKDDPVVRWHVRVRSDGSLGKVTLEDSTDRDPSGDYDARALVRADAFASAHDTWCLLLQAFDHGPLTQLLEEEPQRGLWPLSTGVSGTWVHMDDLPDGEPADDPQQTLGG